MYNPERRLFEVAADGAECVSSRIRSVLRRSKSQLLTGGCADLCRSPALDNRYSVTVRRPLLAAIVQRALTSLLKLALTFAVSGQRTRDPVGAEGTAALLSTQ